MATPKSVTDQAKKAEELQKELLENRDGKKPDPQKQDKTQTELSLVETPDNIPPTDKTVDQDGNWEARFKGLKAVHDTTVTDLRTQLSEANNMISGNTDQVAKLQTEIEELRLSITSEPSAEKQEKVIVSDEEVDEYGQGLIDLISKVSSKSDSSVVDLAKQVLELQGKLDNLQTDYTKTAETGKQSKRDDFFSALDKSIPNWKAVNQDATFHAWLAKELPGTDQERQVFLQQHFDNYDAARVSSVFNEFLVSTGSDGAATSELEESLDSHSSSASQVDSTENVSGEKMWSRKEIQQFYRDKTNGKYKRDPDAARKIDKDIAAATVQGRVRD